MEAARRTFFVGRRWARTANLKSQRAPPRQQTLRFSKVNVFNLLPHQIENLELTGSAKMVLVGEQNRGSGRPNIAEEHSIFKEGCIYAMARTKGIQGN